MKHKKNKTSITLTLGELAQKVNAPLDGDGNIEITGAASIGVAGKGDITFIASRKYLKLLDSTKASAVLLDNDTPCSKIATLRHPNPYLTFAGIIDILYPDIPEVSPGIDSSSIIEDGTDIASSACIGPLCHLKKGTEIGKNSQIISSVYIGKNVTIGDNCLIYPGVRIMNDTIIGNNVIIHASTVLGSDGFGFAESDKGLKKIKQVGWVEIGDNIEIGSNCSIDRGTLGPTKIGSGTKIDNLVHIAHNVIIGNNCIIVAQVGIAGSTTIGNNVVIGGQVGIVGHIEIGDGVRIGGGSGVIKSVKAGKTVFGYPARDIMKIKRIEGALTRLPDLLKRVKNLETKQTE